MTGAQALALGIGAVALLGSLAVFALAWRREQDNRKVGKLDRAAVRADRSHVAAHVPTTAVAQPAPPGAQAPPRATAPPREREVVEVTEDEMGVTRRQFLNRGVAASFGVFLAAFGASSLAFLWPKLSGGFGGKIDAGDVNEIKAAITLEDGTVEPFYVSAARSYVLPFSDVTGTEFAGLDTTADGLVALYQKCVHLGCRVPWCASSQGFECPCHGSKYNAHGEYFAGPAPRNLDRFTVSVSDTNRLIIDTGSRVQTPRSASKSIAYPQGPNCL